MLHGDTSISLDSILSGLIESPFSIAEWFHENTKIFPGSEPGLLEERENFLPHVEALRNAIGEQEEFIASHGKRYASSTRTPLPNPSGIETVSLAEALRSRRSATTFDSSRSIPLEHLSTVLWAAYGTNVERRETEGIRRYVPSAGALYPLEVYLLALRTDELKNGGLYHYQPRDHSLEQIGSCDGADPASRLLTQPEMANAGAVMFVSASLPRVTWKYGERGYRYALLDAGHLAQNACLSAAALGLFACPLAGYYDDAVHDLFWLDGVSEIVVYAMCFG